MSKTVPMRTLLHKAHTNFESVLSRGSVCVCLSNSRHVLKAGHKKIGFCQLLLRNLVLVTLEQWFCSLSCLAFGLPEQLSLECESNS